MVRVSGVRIITTVRVSQKFQADRKTEKRQHEKRTHSQTRTVPTRATIPRKPLLGTNDIIGVPNHPNTQGAWARLPLRHVLRLPLWRPLHL